MSRKFMVMMLVLFGALLYATSLALKKQTEPPPPPSNAEMEAAAKQAKDDGAREKAFEEQKLRMQKEVEKTKPATATSTSSKERLPLPVSPKVEQEQKRAKTDLVITSTWFKNRKQDVEGIAEEERIRERNEKLKPKRTDAAPIVPVPTSQTVPGGPPGA
jgi:hypothetical protein